MLCRYGVCPCDSSRNGKTGLRSSNISKIQISIIQMLPVHHIWIQGLTSMYYTYLYLYVHYTPSSLFKNAKFLSQPLGWFIYNIRPSILRATYSLAFITVIFYYFPRVIHHTSSGAYTLCLDFHCQGHYGGHLVKSSNTCMDGGDPQSPPFSTCSSLVLIFKYSLLGYSVCFSVLDVTVISLYKYHWIIITYALTTLS